MPASTSRGLSLLYCLPFSPTELFVEDTYYSDTPDLDKPRIEQRIADYAARQGWAVTAVSRRESGVLPVVMAGTFDTFWRPRTALRAAGCARGCSTR